MVFCYEGFRENLQLLKLILVSTGIFTNGGAGFGGRGRDEENPRYVCGGLQWEKSIFRW